MIRSLSPLVALLLLGGCASLPLRSAQKKSSVFVQNLGAMSLTQDAYLEAMYPQNLAEPAPWQWRGRNALGAPPQSFIPPQFLGGDEALVVTLGGGVALVNLHSASPKWSFAVPVGVASQPLVVGPSVIVAGMDGVVRRLRLSNGQLEWSSRVSAESMGGVAASQGFIFVTTADNGLWALDEKTGQSRWTYKRPAPEGSVYWSLRGTAFPALSPDGKRLYVGFSDGVFVAIEASSGQTLWERHFDRSGRFRDADSNPQVIQNGNLVLLPLVDGDLLALKSSDGSTFWALPQAGANPPLVDEQEGVLYAALNNGSVQKVSLKDTKILWTTELPAGGLPSSPVAVGKSHISLTQSHGGVLLIERSTGAVVFKENLGSGTLAPPAFDGRRLLVLNSRNKLLFFRVEGPRS